MGYIFGGIEYKNEYMEKITKVIDVNIKSFKAPFALKEINKETFKDCKKLETLDFTNSKNLVIKEFAFTNHNIKNLIISKNVHFEKPSIYPNAIEKITYLSNTPIDYDLLSGKNIEYINIVQPSLNDEVVLDNVVFIDDNLIIYPSGKKDKTYKIPDFVQTAETLAFSNNYLEKLIFPKNFSIFTDEVIYDCNNLKEIVIYDNDAKFSDFFITESPNVEKIVSNTKPQESMNEYSAKFTGFDDYFNRTNSFKQINNIYKDLER